MTPGLSFTFANENEKAKEHQILIRGHPLSRRMRVTNLRSPISHETTYHRGNAYPRANLLYRGETETGGDIPLPQGEGCTPKVT